MKRVLPTFLLKLFYVAGSLMLLCLCTVHLRAQGSDHYGSGVVVKLNEGGSKYFRFITWSQVWTRYIEHNPGSFIDAAGTASSWDIGLRRSRMLVLGKLSEDVLIVSHFGINNQTISTGGVGAPGRKSAAENPNDDGKKPQLFLHDAFVEFRVTGGAKPTDDGLFIGTGLNYCNGLSRMSCASTLNIMTVDAPIFNWTNIDAADQFGRYMGIYAKGKVAGFDYQLTYDMPFRYPVGSAFTAIATDSATIVKTASQVVSNYSARNVNGMFAAYAAYELFEKENRTLPYTVGSYVGTKKVLNVGAGFQYQPDGMWTATGTALDSGRIKRDTADVAMKHVAVDVFLDLPLRTDKDPDAITAYAVYYMLNYGKNYVRNIGIMNPATSATSGQSFNGSGNAMPLLGTGSIFYTQVGYVLPGRYGIFSDGAFSKMRIQPYVALTHSNFEGLKDPYTMPEAGLNLYLDGHNAKITIHYKARPVYDASKALMYSSPEVITQAMVYF